MRSDTDQQNYSFSFIIEESKKFSDCDSSLLTHVQPQVLTATNHGCVTGTVWAEAMAQCGDHSSDGKSFCCPQYPSHPPSFEDQDRKDLSSHTEGSGGKGWERTAGATGQGLATVQLHQVKKSPAEGSEYPKALNISGISGSHKFTISWESPNSGPSSRLT